MFSGFYVLLASFFALIGFVSCMLHNPIIGGAAIGLAVVAAINGVTSAINDVVQTIQETRK